MVTVDASPAFLRGLCTAVAVLGAPCAVVAFRAAPMRRGETPGLAWVMAAARRIWGPQWCNKLLRFPPLEAP
eukprot:2650520-Alexandrium_andersonii.AAC.1